MGVAWLAVFGLFATLITRPAVTVTPASASGLARELNQKSHSAPGSRLAGWRVTDATSVRNVMVVKVDAAQPAQARQIAIQIVEPVRQQYDEVLIYLHRPGASSAARRIQWSPRGGYIEMLLEP